MSSFYSSIYYSILCILYCAHHFHSYFLFVLICLLQCRYNNLNIDQILSSDRLVSNYVECLLSRKPCPPEGKDLKRKYLLFVLYLLAIFIFLFSLMLEQLFLCVLLSAYVFKHFRYGFCN